MQAQSPSTPSTLTKQRGKPGAGSFPPTTSFASLAKNELLHLKAVCISGSVASVIFLGLALAWESLSPDVSGTYLGTSSVAFSLWVFAIAHALHVVDNPDIWRRSLAKWLIALVLACLLWGVLTYVFVDLGDPLDRTAQLMFGPCLLFYYECMFVASHLFGLSKGCKPFLLPIFVAPGLVACISTVLCYVYLSSLALKRGGEVSMAVVSSFLYPMMRFILRHYFLAVVSRKLMRAQKGDRSGDLRYYGTLSRALSMNFSVPGQAVLAMLPSTNAFLGAKATEMLVELAAAEFAMQAHSRRVVEGFTGLLREQRTKTVAAVRPLAASEEEQEAQGAATTTTPAAGAGLSDEDFAEMLSLYAKSAQEERMAQEDIGEKAAAVISVFAGTLALRAKPGYEQMFGAEAIAMRVLVNLALEVLVDMLKCRRANIRFGLFPNRIKVSIDANTTFQIASMSVCTAFISYTGVLMFF